MKRCAVILLIAVSGCAARPQLVMRNPHTGAEVDCAVPDLTAGSREYLTSRACISACQAHGFRFVPGRQPGSGSGDTPAVCLD